MLFLDYFGFYSCWSIEQCCGEWSRFDSLTNNWGWGIENFGLDNTNPGKLIRTSLHRLPGVPKSKKVKLKTCKCFFMFQYWIRKIPNSICTNHKNYHPHVQFAKEAVFQLIFIWNFPSSSIPLTPFRTNKEKIEIELRKQFLRSINMLKIKKDSI